MGVLHLIGRDVASDIKSVPDTFSSWDKCMAKAYCKWPVIIGIVVGSLIILSVVFCVARCICCGAECCCSCLSCCSSSASCCASCCSSGGGGRKERYADGPSSSYQPNPYHGYQPTPHPPPAYEPPRTAQFDAPAKGSVNEDSLPAMPSWQNAQTRRVEDKSPQEEVEMGNLKRRSGQAFGGAGGPGGRGKYAPVESTTPSPYAEHSSPYESTTPTHPYGGDIGTQQARPDYDYARPQPTQRPSFPTEQPGSYNSQFNNPNAQSVQSAQNVQNGTYQGYGAPAPGPRNGDQFQQGFRGQAPGPQTGDQFQQGYRGQAPGPQAGGQFQQGYRGQAPGPQTGDQFQQGYRGPPGPPNGGNFQPVPRGPTPGARMGDHFQPSAMAPTPQDYNNAAYSPQHQQLPNSNFTNARYEPSNTYGQEMGVTQASPTRGPDDRPPSILMAGRKPVQGSWRDV